MSAFTDRIDQARRFHSRLRELFRESLVPVAAGGGPLAELEVLESEITAYHRDQGIEMPAAPPSPEPFGGIFNLGTLGRLPFWLQAVNELGSVRVGFSREARIRDWTADSGVPPVDLTNLGLLPRAELMNLLQTKAFQPDFAAAPITPGPFADADGLLKGLASAIVGRLAYPLAFGIDGPYWNRARIFNPDRILDLTFSALEWNELFPENPVRVIFAGVEEALQHPELRAEVRGVTFPEHPTLPPPWRLMRRFSDGTWHEESLGSSAAGAWEAFLDGMIELANYWPPARRDEIDKALMMRHVDDYRPGDIFHVGSGLPTSWLGDFRIMEDAPELGVVGRNGLAERPSREGIKAREIWFRRFASVIAGALPDPVSERVDKQAFNRDSAQWAAYEDDWEKAYFTYATPATKVGGAPSWVQGACHWRDSAGKPMGFIAQIDDELIEIGDSGRAYVFYSPVTGEIGVVTQCF
jgi:hypothetical protein